MSREFLESFEDGDMIVEVYKDGDEIVMEAEYKDDEYDNIYGDVDVSRAYSDDVD